MSRDASLGAGHRRTAALADLLRTAARLDRTQSDPIVAARNAIGVAAPLAIAAFLGNAAFGLPSAIGALQTAFADRPGPYRLRMLRMTATAVAAAVTGTLAIVCSRSDTASAALLLAVGFLAGLLLATGASGAQVGVAATVAAVVLGHQAQRPGIALHVGLLVLAGGIGQLILAIAAWPLGRHRPERLALAGVYRSLANLARRPPGAHVGPPLGDELAAARQTLFGLGHDHGPSVEAYRVLLDEAERIRREVIVLGGYAERMRRDDPRRGGAAVQSVLVGAARVLDAVAGALTGGDAVEEAVLEPVRADMDRALDVLGGTTNGSNATARAAAARVRALSGQLRAAVSTAPTGATEGSHGEEPSVHGIHRLRDPLAIVRANVSFGSAVMRHAIRLAVLVSASDLVVRAAHLNRGYWVPLTIVVVLRPDFASTFQRSTMRALGTIVGLLLATGLVHWVPAGDWYSIVLVLLFFFGMRLAGPGNVALSAVCLAAVVVILLSLAGVTPHSTVLPRGVDTVVGGALALVATLAWPVWERRLVPARLGELLAAYAVYTRTVADLHQDPQRLQRARAAARLARTNAQASVDRARAEPVPAANEVELGSAVLVHSHRYVHAMLTVEALRPALREGGGLASLAELLGASAEALDCCERCVRIGEAPQVQPGLRIAQQSLVDELRNSVVDGETSAALIEASDRIANSLDTLIDELRRQLVAPDPPELARR
jgi:uncharacterized membrane protein YccC